MRRDINDVPNPFSIEQLAAQSRPRRSLAGAAKTFLIITVSFIVLLAISSQYRQHQLAKLQSDFKTLSPAEKLQRLDQFSGRGIDAVTGLATALCDEHDEVAMRAHQILRDAQQSWTVIDAQTATDNQARLVAAIRSIDESLPRNRVTLAQELLQHTIRSSVDQADAATRQLYFAATAAMQIHSTHDDDGTDQIELADVRDQPLPVTHLAEGVDWVDWPPTREKQPKPAHVRQATFEHELPTVYRADASPLQAVPESEAVLLRDVHDGRTLNVADMDTVETSHRHLAPQITKATPAIQRVSQVSGTDLQSTPVDAVLQMLSSTDKDVRSQATTELKRRGFDEAQVAIATTIVGSQANAKISLIESLTTSSQSDARPWLIMLLRDESREVKLRAITALSTMKDPWVAQELWQRMLDETDQTVAFRIRRVLNLR